MPSLFLDLTRWHKKKHERKRKKPSRMRRGLCVCWCSQKRHLSTSAFALASAVSGTSRRHQQPQQTQHRASTRTPSSSSSSSSSSHSAASSKPQVRTLGEDEGLFQNIHLNSFPVRAAIDIGTGGVASLCIARVDAVHRSVVKVLYQTQLPLFLETQIPSSSSQGGADGTKSGSLMLSEKSITDIKNKMRVLHGAMRRDAYEGLSERAAVISWPLCEAVNSVQLAAELTRELQIDVRVLGKTFHVAWPLEEELVAAAQTDSAPPADDTAAQSSDPARTSRSVRPKSEPDLKALVRDAKKRRQQRQHRRDDATGKVPDQHASDGAGHTQAAAEAGHDVVPAKAQVERLAFLAHGAMAQCVAVQRLLVISEDPQRGLAIVGADTTSAMDVQDLLRGATSPEEIQAILSRVPVSDDVTANVNRTASVSTPETRPGSSTSSSSSSPAFRFASALEPMSSAASDSASESTLVLRPRTDAEIGVVEHRLTVDAADAHRLCITRIQRRDEASYGLHTSSPNPLLAKEFDALVGILTPMLKETLPAWVRRKAGLGGVIAGTSFNGGVLNLAARVSQKTSISLDHLEVHARHHFCGLTDVLLATSFPNPLLVLPSTALACALMRALETPRVAYLPELSTACALLVQPGLWTLDRAAAVRAARAQQRFHQSALHRTFNRPHRKDNPTAAPGAASAKLVGRDALTQQGSYQGT